MTTRLSSADRQVSSCLDGTRIGRVLSTKPSHPAATAAKDGIKRALMSGLVRVGPELLGAGIGGVVGYMGDRTSTGALHGASIGMMLGGLSGGVASRMWKPSAAGETSVASLEFGLSGFAEYSPNQAQKMLAALAKKRYPISVDIRVIDAATFPHPKLAGYLALDHAGRDIVMLKNRTFAELVGVMDHEVTHIFQKINHPFIYAWATSTQPTILYSSVWRFMLELQAHSKHTLFRGHFKVSRGAIASVVAHPWLLSRDVALTIAAGGASIWYASR